MWFAVGDVAALIASVELTMYFNHPHEPWMLGACLFSSLYALGCFMKASR